MIFGLRGGSRIEAWFFLPKVFADRSGWILSNRIGGERSEIVRLSIPVVGKRKNRFQPVDSRFSW